MIQIYNSLTRKKETFVPLQEGKVSMYVCGPTVYNYIHIGNARPVIAFDTVRRYFAYRGYDVSFVSNFTDVDDKLIRAAEELKLTVPEVADRFIDAYFESVTALGCNRADVHPSVTEHIDLIVDFIQSLVEKGFAYASQGDVYYRTRKFETYGKLSQQSIDELRVGARIDVGEKKEDPLDFVLWKAAKPGEIAWDSPWGEGRPGWHIECSAMARKYLGDTIDIHAGGQDLTFPHHENEIAQSEALTGKTFANYWMHNGFINIENEKMSKSLGNFILVKDIVEQIPGNVLRFFMLSVHYRQPINFSQALVEQAENGFNRIRNAYTNVLHRIGTSLNVVDDAAEWETKIAAVVGQFEEAMDDDFNTANAITALYELAKLANIYTTSEQTTDVTMNRLKETFERLVDVLGITLVEEKQLLDADIDALIEERNEARKNRNWKRADEIRDLLKEKNIILEDTAQGVRWKRG
ncbi:MAG: cysteine--tRNA ligase [Bacilli bacterium]